MVNQAAEGLLSPWLRSHRMSHARPFLNGRVLDVGCGAGDLASYVAPERYEGVDRNADVLKIARRRFTAHRFSQDLPRDDLFDTIALLAVIEHVAAPADFLRELSALLTEEGHMVITTPRPSFEWAHAVGARLGLFSRAAHEEHGELLDGLRMRNVAQAIGFAVLREERFLLGANQLFVLGRRNRKPDLPRLE